MQYVSCSILNKLTPEKFDLLKGQLIDAGITSADILKVVAAKRIFELNILYIFFNYFINL